MRNASPLVALRCGSDSPVMELWSTSTSWPYTAAAAERARGVSGAAGRGRGAARTQDAVGRQAVTGRYDDEVAHDQVVDGNGRLHAAAHDLHEAVRLDLRERLELAVLAPVLERVDACKGTVAIHALSSLARDPLLDAPETMTTAERMAKPWMMSAVDLERNSPKPIEKAAETTRIFRVVSSNASMR